MKKIFTPLVIAVSLTLGCGDSPLKKSNIAKEKELVGVLDSMTNANIVGLIQPIPGAEGRALTTSIARQDGTLYITRTDSDSEGIITELNFTDKLEIYGYNHLHVSGGKIEVNDKNVHLPSKRGDELIAYLLDETLKNLRAR